MNQAIRVASVVLILLAGCTKREQASQDACQAGCRKATDLKLARARNEANVTVHELDEQVDLQEDNSAEHIKRLKQELAQGDPPWNAEAVARLPPDRRREALERHKQAMRQLKLQREFALRDAEQQVGKAKERYEKAKAKAEADDKTAVADAMATCLPACLKRDAAFAQCLQRTQAVEDIAICEQR